jgi:hypothetical protein
VWPVPVRSSIPGIIAFAIAAVAAMVASSAKSRGVFTVGAAVMTCVALWASIAAVLVHTRGAWATAGVLAATTAAAWWLRPGPAGRA